MAFEFILTTEEIREKMFDFLKPEYKGKNDLDVVNINWTDGVYDSDNGIFLTLIYRVSDSIARCGMDYYSYIIIMDKGGIFSVSNNYDYEKSAYDFRIPLEYVDFSDIIKAGIAFYRDYRKKDSYMENLDDDTHRKLKEINEIMDDRCHKNFLIACEKDALKLFEFHDCNQYYIRDIYNKETIENFNRYATDDKILRWRSAKCVEILTDIINFNGELNEKYRKAIWYLEMGTDDTYDELFYKAVKSSVEHGFMPDDFEDYIQAYICKYPDKVKNLEPLLDFLDGIKKDIRLEFAIKNARKLIDKE